MEPSRSRIARNYLTSWFLVDFVACLPLHYLVLIFAGDNDDAASAAAAAAAEGGVEADSAVSSAPTRVLKIIRMVRVLVCPQRSQRLLAWPAPSLQHHRIPRSFAKGLFVCVCDHVSAHVNETTFSVDWLHCPDIRCG